MVSKTPIDERGTVQKALSGDGNFDAVDAASVISTGVNFIPGVGQIYGVGTDSVVAVMDADRHEAKIAQEFGIDSVEVAAKNDPAFAKELKLVNGRIKHAIEVSAGGAGGAVAGAMVGSAVLPVAGTLVGTVAGALGAGYVVDAVLTTPHTDAFEVLGNMQNNMEQGQGATNEEVFVLLVESLPENALPKDYIKDSLEKLSGGEVKTLQQALEKRPDIIQQMIQNKPIDDAIRNYNGLMTMPVYPDGTDVSATQLFTAQVNNGVDPRVLLLRQKRMQLADYTNQQRFMAGQQTQIDQGVDVDGPTGSPLPTMDSGSHVDALTNPLGKRDKDTSLV